MNRTIRSPGTSSFCAVYKSLEQCSSGNLPGQLSYRRIIPAKICDRVIPPKRHTAEPALPLASACKRP